MHTSIFVIYTNLYCTILRYTLVCTNIHQYTHTNIYLYTNIHILIYLYILTYTPYMYSI